MVVLSTLTFVISTMEDNLDPGESGFAPFITAALNWIDTFVVVFFTIEYVIRFGRSQKDSHSYLKKTILQVWEAVTINYKTLQKNLVQGPIH